MIKPKDWAFAGEYQRGLTKREYFAALAMQGFCANTGLWNATNIGIKEYAVSAVKAAEYLIVELAKGEENDK